MSAEVGRDGYMCRRLAGDQSECGLGLWVADNDMVHAAVSRLVGMTLWRLEQQVEILRPGGGDVRLEWGLRGDEYGLGGCGEGFRLAWRFDSC